MKLEKWIVLTLLLALLQACASKQPYITFEPVRVGEGGKLIRRLYRSFWTPPASDTDPLTVGILKKEDKIEFRALDRLSIRGWGEHNSWVVASPKGVIWEIRPDKILRPAMTTYHSVIDHQLGKSALERSSTLKRWRTGGYPASRWIGPPRMDEEDSSVSVGRFFLSISPATSQNLASKVCSRFRREKKGTCRVMGRVDLPAVVAGTLRAKNSNFEKKFEGLLEIEANQNSVEVFHFDPGNMVEEKTREVFGPRLFVVPRTDGKLSLVQETTLANYIKGVVPAEIFSSAPAAALEAQAIIARTYVIEHFKHSYSIEPFLTCATTSCQVYRGTRLRTPNTDSAVEKTAGLVLWEKAGRLAETFYHAISGGHTESKGVIWGGKNKRYLRGISDQLPGYPFHPLRSRRAVLAYLDAPPTSYGGIATLTKADRWRWEKVFEASDLKSLAKKAGLRGEISDVEVLKRGVSGRALKLALSDDQGRKVLSGELEIRRLFGGLFSSLFVLEKKFAPNGVLTFLKIRGGAYGHGVGLSQMGAIGRAERGQSFVEILKAYYPGTFLASIGTGVLQ